MFEDVFLMLKGAPFLLLLLPSAYPTVLSFDAGVTLE